MRTRPRLIGIAAATLAALMIVPVATATTGFRDRFHDEYAFSHDDCGWWVDGTGEVNGDFFVRIGKGDFAGAFYGHNNFDFSETHVRRTDGATITISANTLFQETKATHLEGNVYTFTSVVAGVQLKVAGGDGKTLLMDRGRITETIVFDTLGDDVPGGVFIESIDFRMAGKYPSVVTDYCSLFDL